MFGLEILAHINFFSIVSFRAFRDTPHSRFRCRDSNQCFLKMLPISLPKSTRVFHSWKSIDLNSAWLRDSRQYQLSFLWRVLVRLEMRHARGFSEASQTTLIGFFKDARFGPFSNLQTCISLVEVCRFGQCLG